MSTLRNNDLFKQLGLQNLSDEDKLKMSEGLGEVVLNRVADRLEAILTPEQAVEFDTLLQTDEAAAFSLLEKYVPEYPEIVAEEMEIVRSDMINTHAAVMKKLGY
jgi:hypothetical protein